MDKQIPIENSDGSITYITVKEPLTKKLGLDERQYTIYKALYNNVSITEEDRSINAGEQMYVKFAKFLTEPEIIEKLYLTALTDEYIEKINKKVLEDNKVALELLKDK